MEQQIAVDRSHTKSNEDECPNDYQPNGLSDAVIILLFIHHDVTHYRTNRKRKL